MNSRDPLRASDGSEESGATGLDRIACDGCGRFFSMTDGRAMLTMIKGSCPECGGRFELGSAATRRPAGAERPGSAPALTAVLKAQRGLQVARAPADPALMRPSP